jgi:thimet oligopeptidase
VRTFCKDRDVRREMVAAFLNQGYPQNEPLLGELFELREELARLVGYDTWADYDAGVKMIGKGRRSRSSSTGSPRPPGADERDLRVLLERSGATSPTRRDRRRRLLYYEELVRKEQHDVDAQRCAPTSTSSGAQGLLDVTGGCSASTTSPSTTRCVVARRT